MQKLPDNVSLHLMYDIACMLVRHLKSDIDGNTFLEKVKFSVPSFHAYGHSASCQVSYSPLYCEGIGLSDGEVMERMWSYLRRFGRMTKEMGPSHRIDVLSHGLLYYASVKKRKLVTLLLDHWNKAVEMNRSANDTFVSLTDSLKNVSSGMIIQWIKQEKELITTDDFVGQKRMYNWKKTYFRMLENWYSVKEKLRNTQDLPHIESLRKIACSLDSELLEMEKNCGISKRWLPNDDVYIDTKESISIDKRSEVRTCLWACIVKRHYLLRMKAKYADGQKIAKRLCRNITKETRKAKTLVQDYNAELIPTVCISVEDVLSPDAPFWNDTQSSGTASGVPLKVRRDIIEAYLRIKRSHEELELIKREMNSTLMYWYSRINILMEKIEDLGRTCTATLQIQNYDLGVICLLKKLLFEAESYHSEAMEVFSKVIKVDDMHQQHQFVPLQNPSEIITINDNSSSSSEDSADEDRVAITEFP